MSRGLQARDGRTEPRVSVVFTSPESLAWLAQLVAEHADEHPHGAAIADRIRTAQERLARRCFT